MAIYLIAIKFAYNPLKCVCARHYMSVARFNMPIVLFFGILVYPYGLVIPTYVWLVYDFLALIHGLLTGLMSYIHHTSNKVNNFHLNASHHRMG